MYWLFNYEDYERVRLQIIQLQADLLNPIVREQIEQQFPFVGRKSREIARKIVSSLSNSEDIVCDPFSGSGTFGYASLDENRKTFINEWEPYAFRLSTAAFRKIPDDAELNSQIEFFESLVYPKVFEIYKTKCPNCQSEIMFDGLFFDRIPENYFNPTLHERMGHNNENIIFRGKYRCSCGVKEKNYDNFDESIRQFANGLNISFPNPTLIENSRLNFTRPYFLQYISLFSPRQRAAISYIREGIGQISDILSKQ